jgi:hypothetical protein
MHVTHLSHDTIHMIIPPNSIGKRNSKHYYDTTRHYNTLNKPSNFPPCLSRMTELSAFQTRCRMFLRSRV